MQVLLWLYAYLSVRTTPKFPCWKVADCILLEWYLRIGRSWDLHLRGSHSCVCSPLLPTRLLPGGGPLGYYWVFPERMLGPGGGVTCHRATVSVPLTVASASRPPGQHCAPPWPTTMGHRPTTGTGNRREFVSSLCGSDSGTYCGDGSFQGLRVGMVGGCWRQVTL